jgi:hypothetical protein
MEFSVNLDNTDTVQSRTPISQQVLRHLTLYRTLLTVSFIIQKHSSSNNSFAPIIFVFHIILWFNCTPVQHALTSLSTSDVFSPRKEFKLLIYIGT